MRCAPTTRSGAKGTTTKVVRAGIRPRIGPRRYIVRSAAVGMISSLKMNLSASASVWKRPKGPTRLGPRRSWMSAMPRRSTHTMIGATKPIITASSRKYLPKVATSSTFNARSSPGHRGLDAGDRHAGGRHLGPAHARERGDLGGHAIEDLRDAAGAPLAVEPLQQGAEHV